MQATVPCGSGAGAAQGDTEHSAVGAARDSDIVTALRSHGGAADAGIKILMPLDLHFVVAGRPPFHAQAVLGLYEAIQKTPLVQPPKAATSAPLRALLAAMLAKDAGARPSLAQLAANPWVSKGGTAPLNIPLVRHKHQMRPICARMLSRQRHAHYVRSFTAPALREVLQCRTGMRDSAGSQSPVIFSVSIELQQEMIPRL